MADEGNGYQRTLADKVVISGTGLHSGDSAVIVISPADEDSGIVFASNGERINGHAENVTGTLRGTNLGHNGTTFQTVEHLMAALHGMGVDNAQIEVIGSEMPALDGSAKPFVEAICSVGVVKQSKRRRLVQLDEPVWVVGDDCFILAVPAEKLKITYVLSYRHPIIGRQSATFVVTESNFRRNIAPARTFVTYEEVESLMSKRLALGGSLDNAIVIWQDRLSSELRFRNELARHKMLDLIGDLALVGVRLSAEILAVKSGHALNIALARKIAGRLGVRQNALLS